jgi:uncharacterized protein
MTAAYYSAAKAICEAIFSELREQGFWCSAETTPGSAYNVERVASGELEFGIVQSDVLFAAYKGIGLWDGKPVTALRSVLSLSLSSSLSLLAQTPTFTFWLTLRTSG